MAYVNAPASPVATPPGVQRPYTSDVFAANRRLFNNFELLLEGARTRNEEKRKLIAEEMKRRDLATSPAAFSIPPSLANYNKDLHGLFYHATKEGAPLEQRETSYASIPILHTIDKLKMTTRNPATMYRQSYFLNA